MGLDCTGETGMDKWVEWLLGHCEDHENRQADRAGEGKSGRSRECARKHSTMHGSPSLLSVPGHSSVCLPSRPS